MKKVIGKFWELWIDIFSVLLSYFIKRDEDYIAFGSWSGELYSDNTKYLADYVFKHYKNKKIVWVGTEKIRDLLPPEYIFIKLNSLKSIPVLLKCKYMFYVQMHRADICKFNVYRKAVLCSLDHGIPVKKWAMDDPNYKGELEFKNFSLLKKMSVIISGENKKYDYFTVSSDDGVKICKTALAYRLWEGSRIITTGTPRNDFLINIRPEERYDIKRKIANEYGFDAGKRVVAYFPTFRRRSEKIETFLSRDEDEMMQLEKLLKENNAVFLEKNHFAADKYDVNHQNRYSENIIKIDKPVDFQELLTATDIQISDYSGSFLDYTLLDRPIIHYLYDYEEYKNHDSGLYYEAEEFAAGKIVRNFQELISELEKLLNNDDPYKKRRGEIRRKFLTYEDGKASEHICDIIFKDK